MGGKKLNYKYIEIAICVVCKKNYLRWTIAKKRKNVLVSVRSRKTVTCSPKCSRIRNSNDFRSYANMVYKIKKRCNTCNKLKVNFVENQGKIICDKCLGKERFKYKY